MKAIQDKIVDWVQQDASVLELGCGDGDLLARLAVEKGAKAHGIEIEDRAIFLCVGKGLDVLHEEVDTALLDYPEDAFDFVIFDGSLQRVVSKPDFVLQEALRVSRRAIVRFSNFAHYQARIQMILRGRTPVTASLPYEWHDTPNLHFLSVRDFTDYCESRSIGIEKTAFFGEGGQVRRLPNLIALTGLFLISKPSSQ